MLLIKKCWLCFVLDCEDETPSKKTKIAEDTNLLTLYLECMNLLDSQRSPVLATVCEVTHNSVSPETNEETLKLLSPEVSMHMGRLYAQNPSIMAIHTQLGKLPRCAKHGTVSLYNFVFILWNIENK